MLPSILGTYLLPTDFVQASLNKINYYYHCEICSLLRILHLYCRDELPLCAVILYLIDHKKTLANYVEAKVCPESIE